MSKSPTRTTPKKTTARKSATVQAPQGVFTRKIVQILPLRVTDTFDEAFVTLEQSAVVNRFIESPERTGAIQYDDPTLATFPIANLFKENSLLPRVNNPTRISLALADIVKLFSTREINAMGRKWAVKIDKNAISRLITGKSTSLVGSDGENIGVFKVSVATADHDGAPKPIADEILVLHKDLATFLENPVAPGTRQLPYKINFSEAELLDFLNIGAVSIQVDKAQTLSIVVVSDDTTDAKSGLSFRRDIWTPTRIEHLFGVSTKGYLSSSKDIEQAATDGFNALLKRMRSNMNMRSINASRFAGEQVALLLPWEQTWTFEGESLGLRKQTLTLLPEESQNIKSMNRLDVGSSGSSLNNYIDSLLSADQDILKSNAVNFVNVGSPLTLTKELGQKSIGIKSLEARNVSFAASLAQKVGNQHAANFNNSEGSKHTEKVTKEWINSSPSSMLELTEYQPLNQFIVETVSIPSDMSLGYIIENPFLSLPLNTDTIMRYQNIFATSILEKDLVSGFKTIGRVVEHARIQKLQAAKPVKSSIKEPKSLLNQRSDQTVTDKEFELISMQRKNLEDRLQATLEIVQEASLKLLDDDLLDKTCETVAAIGDQNAARIVGVPKGSASVDAVSQCRLFVSRQLYERKFPALFNVISDIAKLSATDLNPRIWGERFSSALPTPFDIFDLVNLANEPLREIQAVYEPLIAPMAQTSSDVEQWWSKLDAMSMTIPLDNGLSRAIERLLIGYVQLLRFDAGDFHSADVTNREQLSIADENNEELYLARRLIRHIQDNAHYYIGQIFAGQSHRKRIEMLRSAIEVKAPEVRHEAFDFNQVSICGYNIIVGINADMVDGAETFLKKLNKEPAQKASLSVNVPISGSAVRGRSVKLGT